MSETAASRTKTREPRKRRRPAPPARPRPYARYRPLRAGEPVPADPLFRYQTNQAGYITCKYILPAAAAGTYLAFFARAAVLDGMGLGYALFSPTQVFCLAALVAALYLFSPLAHIIVCEEGMYVSKGLSRVFVPWKHLRSYRPSRNLNPWVIIISYYMTRSRKRRVFAITSLSTEHTLTEIVNFIHKVRQSAVVSDDENSE
jgi:hypothetical protein